MAADLLLLIPGSGTRNRPQPGELPQRELSTVATGRVTHPQGPQLLGNSAPIEYRPRLYPDHGIESCFRQVIPAIAAKLDYPMTDSALKQNRGRTEVRPRRIQSKFLVI